MITYEQLAAAALVFVAVLVLIVQVNNARKAIDDMRKPYTDLREMVLRHDEELKHGDAHMGYHDDAIRLLMENDLLVMQHMAYGNHTDQLVSQIGKVQGFLLEGKK